MIKWILIASIIFFNTANAGVFADFNRKMAERQPAVYLFEIKSRIIRIATFKADRTIYEAGYSINNRDLCEQAEKALSEKYPSRVFVCDTQ